MAIFGVQPYGVGTNAVAQDGGGKAITNPYTGVQNGSRKIDPYTRDYVFDSTGRIEGMTNAQQLVYLAVRTDKGSSAMRALGQELHSIQRITSNFTRRVDTLLKEAVQHIVDRGIIEVVGTQVDLVRPGVAKARIRWRDIDTGDIEVTEIGHATAAVGSPPILSSMNYDLVDSAGGSIVTLIGSSLNNATSVTVGGTSATILLNTRTSLTFTVPAKASGTYSVVVTTGQGTSNSLSIEYWQPSDLTLTGRWAPNFSGSPWVGATGGNLTTASSAPSTSSAVNGFTGADFTPNNDLQTGSVASSYYNAAAYTMVALVYVDTFTVADPGAALPYNCPQILGYGSGNLAPAGGIAGSGSTGVFRWGHYNGSSWTSAACTVARGAWTMVMARYTGTNIEVGRNAEAVVQTAHGNVASLTSIIKVGPDSTSTNFLDAKVLYLLTANTAISDTNRDKLRRYFNSKYTLGL